MSVRLRRPKIQAIQNDALAIVRSFPSTYVVLLREVRTLNDLGESSITYTVAWRGEVLVKPVSGTVQRLSMGQIDTDVITIFVPGKHDFEQGMFARYKDELFQVQRVADYFRAFTVLDLNQYQQQA